MKKKTNTGGKDKSNDIGKLKQKLDKINANIEILLEEKVDILRQIKEAGEVESHPPTEKSTEEVLHAV